MLVGGSNERGEVENGEGVDNVNEAATFGFA